MFSSRRKLQVTTPPEISRRIFSSKVAGLLLLLVPLAAGLISLSPGLDPLSQNLMHRLSSPSLEHPLGTDHLGRCLLARIAHGTYISMGSALLIALCSAALGALLGMIAGYIRGIVDMGIGRLVDTTLAFPGILLALMLAGLTGGGVLVLAAALIITTWPEYCRLARSVSRTLSGAPYVQAGVLTGFTTGFILRRYLLPQVIRPLLPLVSLGVGKAILALSSLGFLGIGVTPPAPEWGAMISAGLPYLREAPHLAMFPSVLIFMTVLGFILLSGHFEKKDAGFQHASSAKSEHQTDI